MLYVDRIAKIEDNGKRVFVIDYSDCKEDDMIILVSELKNKIKADGKSVLILSVFNDAAYVTSTFMRHAEHETQDVLHLIEKQAMVGLNDTKKMILKGYNFLFQKNIPVFNSKETALNFLFDDQTSDRSTLWDVIH